MQLTTVGKEVFRGARKALGPRPAQVTPQPRQLKQVEALRKREAPWSVGLSRALLPLEGKAQGRGTHRPETQK